MYLVFLYFEDTVLGVGEFTHTHTYIQRPQQTYQVLSIKKGRFAYYWIKLKSTSAALKT